MHGFETTPKRIPARFFLNERGRRILGCLRDLPDYYASHCEAEILQVYGEQILDQIGNPQSLNIVELGVGRGTHSARRLRMRLGPKDFVLLGLGLKKDFRVLYKAHNDCHAP